MSEGSSIIGLNKPVSTGVVNIEKTNQSAPRGFSEREYASVQPNSLR